MLFVDLDVSLDVVINGPAVLYWKIVKETLTTTTAQGISVGGGVVWWDFRVNPASIKVKLGWVVFVVGVVTRTKTKIKMI